MRDYISWWVFQHYSRSLTHLNKRTYPNGLIWRVLLSRVIRNSLGYTYLILSFEPEYKPGKHTFLVFQVPCLLHVVSVSKLNKMYFIMSYGGSPINYIKLLS